MYVYTYSLYVSGSHTPIIRRIIVSIRHLVYVTLCRRQSGMQEHMLLHTTRSSTQSDINQVSHWYSNSPDDGHMAARNMHGIDINIHVKLCANLVIYKNHSRMHGQQNVKYMLICFLKLPYTNKSKTICRTERNNSATKQLRKDYKIYLIFLHPVGVLIVCNGQVQSNVGERERRRYSLHISRKRQDTER